MELLDWYNTAFFPVTQPAVAAAAGGRRGGGGGSPASPRPPHLHPQVLGRQLRQVPQLCLGARQPLASPAKKGKKSLRYNGLFLGPL